MKCSARFLAVILTSVLGTANAHAGISSLYVFGDSLSDAGDSPHAVVSAYKNFGDCDPTHPCPPYVNGRYSNGPVAAEYLANALLAGNPNAGAFLDFAVAGSTTGVGNYGDFGTAEHKGLFGFTGMQQQVDYFVNNLSPIADPNALYLVWGGANDFLTADSPLNAAQNIADFVADLSAAGAKHILVPNLPDLGAIPLTAPQGSAASALGHAFSTSFNQALELTLSDLTYSLPSTQIIQFDLYGLLNTVLANPAAYGITNASNACVTSTSLCANQGAGYLFWDELHPTTQMHQIIAAAMLSQVPLPSSLVLFVSPLLLWCGRRIRARSV